MRSASGQGKLGGEQRAPRALGFASSCAAHLNAARFKGVSQVTERAPGGDQPPAGGVRLLLAARPLSGKLGGSWTVRAAALGGSSARPAAGFALGRANRQLRHANRSQSGPCCSVCCAKWRETRESIDRPRAVDHSVRALRCWVEHSKELLAGWREAPSPPCCLAAWRRVPCGRPRRISQRSADSGRPFASQCTCAEDPLSAAAPSHGQCRNLRPEGVPPTHGLHGRVCSGGEQRHKRVGAA